MSDYYDRVDIARSRLRVLTEALRQVERREFEPIGPTEAGLYADWCDAIAQVLAQL